jgi:hypothetical protein
MEKRTARHHSPQPRERAKGHKDQPIWEKTTPRGNQEVDARDLNRSAERLEMLLGH